MERHTETHKQGNNDTKVMSSFYLLHPQWSWNNNVPSPKLMSELQQSAKTGKANKVTSDEAFRKNWK